MRRKNFQIVSDYDGLKLDVLALLPEGGDVVKGIVQISHGMCENKERYEPLMEFLCERGFVCVIHDHRGHGRSVKSPEDLGYMYGGGADAMVEDLFQLTQAIRRHWEKEPLILIGHSMGTLVARSYVKKYDDKIDVLVLSGSPSRNPALRAGQAVAYIQKLLQGRRHKSKLLEALSFGPYVKKFAQEESRFAWCCSDKKVVEAYDSSPLCGFTFTVDGYLALFQLMERTYGSFGWQCKNPDLPILFVSGADDPCLTNVRRFKAALDHMRRQGYWNVRGKLYPGLRHEIFNETEKEKIYDDVYRFIMRSLA